jgi:hypothetical protein
MARCRIDLAPLFRHNCTGRGIEADVTGIHLLQPIEVVPSALAADGTIDA